MRCAVYLNESRDSFMGFDPENAELTKVYEFDISELFWGQKLNIPAIQEWMFEEFNVGTDYHANEYRKLLNRSLSVGDVIVIGEMAFACSSVGWERITTEQLQGAMLHDAVKDGM